MHEKVRFPTLESPLFFFSFCNSFELYSLAAQDKGNNGNKAKSMVESPSKGHKRRHGGGGAGGTGAGGGTGGEVPGPDREQAGNGNEDERGPPRQKKKKNDTNSEVSLALYSQQSIVERLELRKESCERLSVALARAEMLTLKGFLARNDTMDHGLDRFSSLGNPLEPQGRSIAIVS